ncbi:MAG: hypothetical protein RBU37_12300 [Myxococcota bacterium]|nr:hypothetical protein [Myxococcota bacterium]
MGEAFFEQERAFSTQSHRVAALLCRTPSGNLHAGLLYRDKAGSAVLHLAWQAYGEGVIDALGEAFKTRGVSGLSARNLRNYRKVALTWPSLGIRQTLSGEAFPALASEIWQTPSAESLPSLNTANEPLPWQDEAWMLRLRRELSFSHLLELSRVTDPVARAFYEVQNG